MPAALTYRNTSSHLHALHPLAFSSWVVLIVASALLVQHPAFLVVLAGLTVVVAASARVFLSWWSVVRYTFWMGLAIIVINVVASNEGSHVLLQAGFRLPVLGVPTITLEALAFGTAMAVRLAVIISAFTLLNLCVHPDDLMRAAIKLRLPYRSVLVTSLSTRFVPVLMDDAQTITDVQRSRGLEFDAGGLGTRIRNRGALILPLLSNSLDRAVQVAEAMESRAYGAAPRRTFLKDVPVRPPDVLVLAVVAAMVALVVWLHIAGISTFAYYPNVSFPDPGPADYFWLIVFTLGLASVVPLASLRSRVAA